MLQPFVDVDWATGTGESTENPVVEVLERMQPVLIVVHLIIVLALIGVVLLQRSEGGLGLGGGGGGVSGFMTGRGQANALTRATAILAGLFFLTSITLSIMATHGRKSGSILDTVSTQSAPVAGSPSTGGTQGQQPNLLEQLGGQSSQPAAPATGTAPAPAGSGEAPKSQ